MSGKAAKQRRRQSRADVKAADRRKDRMTTIVAVLAFVAIVGGAIAYVSLKGGHGAASSSTSASVAPALPPAPTGGLPKQISANIAEQNQVIETPIHAKLASLRGVPIVVNQWASWCPNCKAEFPFFQRQSRRFERQVAFLGLDAQDQRAGAVSFLRTHPVVYPSVFDESAQQASSLGGGQGWPTTFFFDRTGKETFVHEGAYPTEELLEADVRRYALGA